ncbi:hypothetical protein AK812_SmicGene10055 [Symbiodinium microadriaticum]|uniref:Uncharacterized protein n=1 Tax=Symbiodinium microadriaticum TaxID=2951 RepID=A0A1Q9EGV5_SYMMI|nr:hypothetical protein AK812_SmicGene10055 [Symbiodinium microadriaticum]
MREDNFLQKFHDLGSADEEKRCRAARGMTVALQGDRLGSEDLSYTIRRLVRGAECELKLCSCMDQRAHHAAINKLDMELDEYMAFDDASRVAWLAEELGVRPSDLSFLQALPPALQRNICETFDSSGTKDGNTLERLEAYARLMPQPQDAGSGRCRESSSKSGDAEPCRPKQSALSPRHFGNASICRGAGSWMVEVIRGQEVEADSVQNALKIAGPTVVSSPGISDDKAPRCPFARAFTGICDSYEDDISTFCVSLRDPGPQRK